MTNFIKLATASTIALALTACATTDDRYQVGVDDNDQYAANTAAQTQNAELSDAQTFGFNDDDQYETRTVATSQSTMTMTPEQRSAVASRIIRKDATITQGVSMLDDYSTVNQAIADAGLAQTFDGRTEYTVFAPNNAAFEGMDLSNWNQMQLQDRLKYHVVQGSISSDMLAEKLMMNNGSVTVETLSGENLRVFKVDDQFKVADERGYVYTIEAPDNQFRNGYVHGITGVLAQAN